MWIKGAHRYGHIPVQRGAYLAVVILDGDPVEDCFRVVLQPYACGADLRQGHRVKCILCNM